MIFLSIMWSFFLNCNNIEFYCFWSNKFSLGKHKTFSKPLKKIPQTPDFWKDSMFKIANEWASDGNHNLHSPIFFCISVLQVAEHIQEIHINSIMVYETFSYHWNNMHYWATLTLNVFQRMRYEIWIYCAKTIH